MCGITGCLNAEAEELKDIESERAKQRQVHGQTAPGKNASGHVSVSDKGETRDKVAEQIGLGSGRTYDIDRILNGKRLSVSVELFLSKLITLEKVVIPCQEAARYAVITRQKALTRQ